MSPGGNAVIALIFAEYTNRIFWHATKSDISPDDVPQWMIKLTAVASILLVTGLCVSARNTGARAAVIFTTVKVSPISNHYNLFFPDNFQIIALVCVQCRNILALLIETIPELRLRSRLSVLCS